jgi:hypothetical protein
MLRTFKTALLATALVLAATASASADAEAVGACLPHSEAVAKLNQRYDEHQVGIGLGSRGSSVVELFVAETGTWTILITHTNGMSCISASGDNWSSSPLRVGDAT